MNWTWDLRSNDGAMNGLEFARCTTAGGFPRALVHACPAKLSLQVATEEGKSIAQADLEREADYSPMTLLTLDGTPRRQEVWPDESLHGVPVILAGGEVGILRSWEHSEDRSWWRWSVEFANHKGRPQDWAPEGEDIQR